MSRSLVARTAALVLALTFTSGLVGEAYGWHRCPHHHPNRDVTNAKGAASPPASSGSSAAATDRAGRATDAVEGLRVQPPPSRPLHPRQGKTCTCVGNCHGSAAAPLAPAPPAGPAEDGIGLEVSLSDRNGVVVPGLSPYMLPYANAPPSR